VGAAVALLIVRLWSISELTLLLNPRRQISTDIAWFYFADAVMDRWGIVVVVLIVYAIAMRKEGIRSPTRRDDNQGKK